MHPRTASKLFYYTMVTLPSVPIAYGTAMKELYENVKAILTNILYDDHNLHICADFKVTGLFCLAILNFAASCAYGIPEQ